MRTTRRTALAICFVVAWAWCAAASPAVAQTAAGEITGIVKDQAGAAVPGATITVTETRTNLQRVTVSTDDGVYTAPSLAPGEYRLDVKLAGFKPVRREGIRLSTGEKARVDFDTQLKPIFKSKCMPCHFSGGKMYDSLPFDRPETIRKLGTKLFTRIKEEDNRRLIEDFLAQSP